MYKVTQTVTISNGHSDCIKKITTLSWLKIHAQGPDHIGTATNWNQGWSAIRQCD